MANPQRENGFTGIANEILEKVISTPFISTHLKIILVCWRYSYGFNKKSAELSESFIANATGISKRYISSELKTLFDCKVLKVIKEASYTSSRVIAFNKNYDEWEYRSTVPQVNQSSTVEPEYSTTVEPQFNTTDELQFHQKRKHKENINKYSSQFEFFYKIYPRPAEKKRTLTNWNKCLKEYSPEEIIKAAENYKAKVEAANTDKQYIKTSANFLGRDKFFEDYIYLEQPEETKPNPEYLKLKEALNNGIGTGL